MDDSKRISVLFLTSLFDTLGGSEKNILELARNLPRGRFQTFVFALKGGVLLQEIRNLGIHGEEIGLDSLLSLNGLLKGYELFRFLRKEKIDALVTVHEDADLWGGLIGRLARVPVILSSKRDMGYQITRKQRFAYRYINSSFTRFVAVSQAVKREIAKTQRIPESKFEVIYSGIAMDKHTETEKSVYLHNLLGVSRSHRLIGMVASFRPVKGQECFVRAAARLLERERDVEFVIVGYKETDYFNKVVQVIHELGISGKVHCIGHRSDVPEILQSLDIFVLSSLHEGFSNALLEAMAAGLPVIAPESGGNPEIVNPDNGILFKPGDVKELAKAMLRLLDNENERREMGRLGKALVKRKFSLNEMIRKYDNLFRCELHRVNR